MSGDALSNAGLYFDELNKVRVLDPEITQETSDLRDECKQFVDKMNEFQKIVGSFIGMVDDVAKQVEKEKMEAIGARNFLKSIGKEREAQQQQLQSLAAEKKMQLDRLRVQYDSLQKTEAEQLEFIEQFSLQK